MADRDPFPMRSEEAKRLAASVDTGTQDDVVNWDKMGTGTEVAAPMAYSGEAEEPEGGGGGRADRIEERSSKRWEHIRTGRVGRTPRTGQTS